MLKLHLAVSAVIRINHVYVHGNGQRNGLFVCLFNLYGSPFQIHDSGWLIKLKNKVKTELQNYK